jgi:hypothetical protein
MKDALLRYSKEFSHILTSPSNRRLFFSEVNKRVYLNAYCSKIGRTEKERALRLAFDWFQHNQDAMQDAGFGTYYLSKGWTSSYPETSGYIVPSLLNYAQFTGNPTFQNRAFACLDWLLSIQFREGGWQSGYIHQLRDAVVFNTAQVMRGMLAGHQAGRAGDLQAAEKAAQWLVKVQQADGAWGKHNFLGVSRVYDAYVAAPLLELWRITNNAAYRDAAIKNLNWIVDEKQMPNGWFRDCDNTRHKNHMPIIHTIAYTIDGLLDAGLLLRDEKFIAAAQKPAQVLAELFIKDGILNGRYNNQWKGKEAFITTGGAQLAIIWFKLFQHTNAAFFYTAATQMTTLLTALQDRHIPERPETKGALFGSFPFWGRYEAFGLPNWGTKYFVDALMLEFSIKP